MPRPLFDSPYLFGLHEPGGESHMLAANKPGWLVFTEGIGSETNDFSGKDFSAWSNQGLGILCRLNNGYEPGGTIPHSSRYGAFAQRCANFVSASRGCKLWIIGNEMNHPVERPGVQIDWSRAAQAGGGPDERRAVPWRFNALLGDMRAARMAIINPGEVITPALYAQCYLLCRAAIKRIPGHADDQVLVGAVAPWNNLTTYAGNSNGDWVQYYRDILLAIGREQCDGITLHTYSHSADPATVSSDQFMGAPFQNRQYNFRAYRDFMNATPPALRDLPVYITETDQDVPWENNNRGWVQRAYAEIDAWNRQTGNQQIRSLVLYRWPNRDRWVIEGKQGVIDDLGAALTHDYRWRDTPWPSLPAFSSGQTVTAAAALNLRRTPGFKNKPAGDVLVLLPVGATCTVLAGPQQTDALEWWQLRYTAAGQTQQGWAARLGTDGSVLIAASQPSSATFSIGQSVWTADALNLRRSAGFLNKPAADIIYELPAAAELVITGGAQASDGLSWWQVRFTSPAGNRFTGWVAEAKTSGEKLLLSSAPDTGSTPPPTVASLQIGQKAAARAALNLRLSAGYLNKPANDVLYQIPGGGEVTLVEGPTPADGLTWWRVRYISQYGNPFLGWAAEKGKDGEVLLAALSSPAPQPQPQPQPQPEPEPQPQPALKVGDTVQARSVLNLRRTPGFKNKPANDITYEIPTDATLLLLTGPQNADDLAWWQVRFTSQAGNRFEGWVAERLASGEVLLALTASAPTPQPAPSGKFTISQRVYAGDFINLRRTPGYVNKTAADVVIEAPLAAGLVVLAGPQPADDLTWWQMRYADSSGAQADGWAAEANSQGKALLLVSAPPPPLADKPIATKTFALNDVVINAHPDLLNVRRTPGYSDKQAQDVVGQLPSGGWVVIVEGPREADALRWWRVAGAVNGTGLTGWVAEVGAKGQRFLLPLQLKDAVRLGKPFEGTWRVTQLFGDRPEFYGQYSYDGVKLRGHNGVDFGTPNGTVLLATDDGTVAQVGYEAGGFGNFVKLSHTWGDSIYAHMERVSVKEGDTLHRGDALGVGDNTGNSSGPHLHFAVRIYPYRRGDGWGGYCDPVPFMNATDVIIPDGIRTLGPTLPPPGMTPDQPGRERP